VNDVPPHLLTAHEVARRVAEILAAPGSPAQSAAFTRFAGKSLNVHLDAIGRNALALPLPDRLPSALVSARAEEGRREERTLDVEVLLEILVADEYDADASRSELSANGVWEIAGSDALQECAAGIVAAVSMASPGAIFRDWDADWDFGSEFPVQSALLTFHFSNLFTY